MHQESQLRIIVWTPLDIVQFEDKHSQPTGRVDLRERHQGESTKYALARKSQGIQDERSTHAYSILMHG